MQFTSDGQPIFRALDVKFVPTDPADPVQAGSWYLINNGGLTDKRDSQRLCVESAEWQADAYLQAGEDVVITIFKQDGRKREVHYFYADQPIVTTTRGAGRD